MQNKEALQFIYDRIINLHKENEHYDYMLNFKRVIDEKQYSQLEIEGLFRLFIMKFKLNISPEEFYEWFNKTIKL